MSLFARILKQKIPIFLIIFMLAVVGYRLSSGIPQGVFPNVYFPRVMVTIENGYTPIQQMLLQVTRPAEDSLKTVQGVEKVTSGTSIGSVEINLFFDWKTDPQRAFQLVQSRIAELKNGLPSDAKVTVIQATPSRFPVAIYAIGSNQLSREQLTDRLYYHIKPILLSVKGIYDLEISAPEWQEYQVVLDLEKLKGYHLSIDDVAKVLKDQNDIEFLGVIKDYHHQHIVSLSQKPDHVQDIANIRFPLEGGGSVALSDIAQVILDHEPLNQMSAASGFQNSVVFNILRQPDANSTDVVRDVDAQIQDLNRQLAKDGIEIRKSYDETRFVTDAVKSVQEAIVLGTLIGAFVVFLFLRKFKLSLFLILIVPIVFLITLIGIHLIHFDFNIFSLGGMAAAIGGLIDHLIIVIENIERHYHKTGDRLEAVIEGSREILPIMTVATLLSVLIFVPLLLVSGVVGVFFKQLAFVLISTYVISQLLAVFFTPIIAYIALPKTPEEPKSDWLDHWIHRYAGFLGKFMDKAWISLPIIGVGALAIFLFYQHLPSTFLPKWDEGSFVVDILLPSGVSIDESYQEFMRAGKIISAVPEVENWSMRVGNGLGHPSVQPNEGDFLVTLKKNRSRSIDAITDDLRERLSQQFPNLEELDLPHVLEDRLGDILGEEAPISVMLYGTDPQELIDWGGKLRDALRQVDCLEEVNLKTNTTSPAIDLKLKPEAESLYGIDRAALSAQVNSLYWGQTVGEVVQGERVFGIRLIAQHPAEDPIDYLKNHLTVYSSRFGSDVPLSAIATIKQTSDTPEVAHYNLSPVALIAVRFKGNDMSLAVRKVRETLAKLSLPQDITPKISGFYEEQQKSFQELLLVVGASILILFTALLMNFGDLRIAISVLLGLIMTLVGVFAALALTGRPIDITAFMGMLIVLSIVINNNVLIFDYYQKNREHHESEREALVHAVEARFRPILMTMLSNVFALLPVALALGTGTQLIQNMAIAIMGGLLLAIFISLFLVPQLLMLFLTPKKGMLNSLRPQEVESSSNLVP